MKAVNITNAGVQWRVFEREHLEKYFGPVVDIALGDLEETNNFVQNHGDDAVIFWRPNSDIISPSEYQSMIAQRELLSGCKFVNDGGEYLNYHAKEKAFAAWNKIGVPCPKHLVIEDNDQFLDEYDLEYPFLIRLNNEVSGRSSYLVKNEVSLISLLNLLKGDWERAKLQNPFTERIAVQFIDATKEDGQYNLSYRIIVAGNKVITGYARLSEASDWVAITGKFKPEMEENFVKYQKRCQKVIEENHDLICRAVHSLGLNHQGVDVIEDQSENLFFLECQPGYSTGYSNWPKPFYNPYYPELVKFLVDNKSRLQEEIPMYYNKWLDKETLFDEAYSSLADFFQFWIKK